MASWNLQLLRTIGLIFIVKFRVNCSQESSVAFQDNFLLVADSADNALYQVELSTHNRYRLPIDPLRPIAVTFDWTTRDVYWSSNYSSIHRYSFVNNSTNTIYSDPQNVSCYVGLAVDVWSRKLYYSDSAKGQVAELTVNSSGQATLQRLIDSDINSRPNQLVLDITNSLLYWVDWSRAAPALYFSSTVNNTTKTKIISTGISISSPRGLAIDLPGQVMYIGDSGNSRIVGLRVDGSGGYSLPGVYPATPYSLAVHSQNLYFIDQSTNALRDYNRLTNTTNSQIVQFVQPNGIAIYSSAEVNQTAPLHTTAAAATTTTTPFFSQSTLSSSPAEQSSSTKSSTTTTIIIAVVVSVGGSIVLVLILVFIVVTCRRCKRPGRCPELTKSFPAVRGESFDNPRYKHGPRPDPPALPPLRPSPPPVFQDNHIDSTYLEPTVGSEGQYLSLELDYIASPDTNTSHVTSSQRPPAQSRVTAISDDYEYDDAA